MKSYIGAGSSSTPADALLMMTQVAGVMSRKGISLRCSEQSEADMAFVKGARGRYYAFIPCGKIDESLDDPDAKSEPGSPWAITANIEPASSDATFARKLDATFLMLSRAEKQWEVVANSLVYGLDHENLAKMMICWSQPGDHVERFINKAVQAKVPVFNLAVTKDRATIQQWIDRG